MTLGVFPAGRVCSRHSSCGAWSIGHAPTRRPTSCSSSRGVRRTPATPAGRSPQPSRRSDCARPHDVAMGRVIVTRAPPSGESVIVSARRGRWRRRRHGEAETGAAFVAAAPFVESHEAAHDVASLVGGDPGAVVVDVDGDVVPAVALDRHGRPRWPPPLPRWRRDDRTPARARARLRARSPHPAQLRATRDRDAATARRDLVDDDVRGRRRRAAKRHLVAAGEQQQVVDEQLEAIELGEQDVARRRPVRRSDRAGRPPTRCASRRPACAARGRRPRRVGDSSRSTARGGRASGSSCGPARRSRRRTLAPATRSCSERDSMPATWAVMLRTGRRARPASSHDIPPTSSTNAGHDHPQRLTGAIDRRLHVVERRHRRQHGPTDRARVEQEVRRRRQTETFGDDGLGDQLRRVEPAPTSRTSAGSTPSGTATTNVRPAAPNCIVAHAIHLDHRRRRRDAVGPQHLGLPGEGALRGGPGVVDEHSLQ